MKSDLLLSYQYMKDHPTEVARILERLDLGETTSFLMQAPVSLAAEVMRLMSSFAAAHCLERMDANSSAAIIANLPVEVASILLRRLQAQQQESILKLVPDKTSAPLQLMLSYPEGTAGALMDSRVFTLPDDITVREALKRIKFRPEYVTDYLYVVNRDHRLVGVAKIRKLMLSELNDQISAVMHGDTARLSADVDLQAILAHPGWREFHTLPVVDRNDTLLGAIGYRTLRRIESDAGRVRESKPANTTGAALGELYWLGLSGIINGTTAAFNREKK